MGELEGSYVPGVPRLEPAAMRRWIILVVAFMTTLAFLAVAGRLWCRHIRKQKFWWDDYLIMFSMIWNWIVVGIGFAMYIEGVGYHDDTVGREAVINISRWLLITEIIYVWNLCWTKLSLLFMYYRIFRFPLFKKLVIGVGAYVVVWAICVSFLFTFICVPVEKLWRPELPGHCVSELGVWLANASSTIFSDIVILLLPIPQVWRLQLKTTEKVGLTFVFSLGFFAVFASSYRTWVLFNYSKHDVSYTLAPLLAWSDIEMSAGIISACLPTMRPVVRLLSSKLGVDRFLGITSKDRTGTDRSASASGGKHGRNDSRGPTPLHGFITPQTLKTTAESTSRPDRSSGAFYRLPDDYGSSFGGILVETSLELVETQKQSKAVGQVKEVHGRSNGRSDDESSVSFEMHPRV